MHRFSMFSQRWCPDGVPMVTDPVSRWWPIVSRSSRLCIMFVGKTKCAISARPPEKLYKCTTARQRSWASANIKQPTATTAFPFTRPLEAELPHSSQNRMPRPSPSQLFPTLALSSPCPSYRPSSCHTQSFKSTRFYRA